MEPSLGRRSLDLVGNVESLQELAESSVGAREAVPFPLSHEFESSPRARVPGDASAGVTTGRQSEVITVSDTESSGTDDEPLVPLPQRGPKWRHRPSRYDSEPLPSDTPSYRPRAARKSARGPPTINPKNRDGAVSRSTPDKSLGGFDVTNIFKRAPPSAPRAMTPVDELDRPLELNFSAAGPSHKADSLDSPTKECGRSTQSRAPVGADSAFCPLDQYKCCTESSSSVSSPVLSVDFGSIVKFINDDGPPDCSKSPTPPWGHEVEDIVEVVDTVPNPRSPGEASGVTPPEAETASSPQKLGALPDSSEPDPATDLTEELDISADPVVEVRTTENETFSDQEMGALHRFLGRLVPVSEKGFRSTALDLARQLHDMFEKRVEGIVRSRFERGVFDPTQP